MKRVNIIIGRFQPFTKGHYKCVEEAWQKKHVPTVICMIETPETKVDQRHPFSSDMLIDLYNEWFKKDPKIEKIITVKNADIVKISEILDGYEIVSWVCGTDRYDSYKTMAERYAEQAHLPEDFEVIEIKRTDEDVSATKARQALLDNNRTEFIKLVPSISLSTRLKSDIFTILKDQILKVYNS